MSVVVLTTLAAGVLLIHLKKSSRTSMTRLQRTSLQIAKFLLTIITKVLGVKVTLHNQTGLDYVLSDTTSEPPNILALTPQPPDQVAFQFSLQPSGLMSDYVGTYTPESVDQHVNVHRPVIDEPVIAKLIYRDDWNRYDITLRVIENGKSKQLRWIHNLNNKDTHYWINDRRVSCKEMAEILYSIEPALECLPLSLRVDGPFEELMELLRRDQLVLREDSHRLKNLEFPDDRS